MKVRLHPVSDSDLDELEFDGVLFSIGRQDPPFSDYPEAVAGGISRRHARLFVEDGELYLFDLRSRNGSTVNGKEVGDLPMPIANGDIIGFAGDLFYKVSISREDNSEGGLAHRTQLVRLFLTPVSRDRGIDTIAVMEFPFMIGKDDEVFSRYQNRFKEEVSFLSRRHAYIYLSDGEVIVEDLGSTNGTFVNGKLLEDEARKLRSGDEVSFGGNFFSYLAVIERADGKPKGDTVARMPGVPSGSLSINNRDTSKTAFVTSATSFLDIFCFDDVQSDNEVDTDDGGEERNKLTDNDVESGRKKSPGAGVLPFLRRLRDVLTDEDGRYQSRYIGAFSAMAAVVILFSWWYVQSGERRRVEALCSTGKARECVRQSSVYLGKEEGDRKIHDMAFVALLKGYLPEWISAIESGDFEKAKRLRESANAAGKGIEGEDRVMHIMERIERLESFISQKSGGQIGIEIDRDEVIIGRIVKSFEEKKDIDRRLMIRMVESVPKFDAVRVRVFSNLRRLQNDQSLYVSAISDFKSELSKLLGGESERISEALALFQSRYPRVTGLDRYWRDVDEYERFQQASKESNLLKRIELLQKLNFVTPLFQHELDRRLADFLPPNGVRRVFELTLEDWRNGRTTSSASRLRSIRDAKWKKLAQQELKRQEDVLRQYERLQRARGSGDEYGDLVTNFYASLDEDIDRFFVNATRRDFLKNRKLGIARAKKYLQKAGEQWAEYLVGGRISSLERLEERVSRRYREQATKLANAFLNVTSARRIYEKLGVSAGKKEQLLIEAVTKEMDTQKGAIDALKGVQSESHLDAKLRLLSGQRSGDGR